MYELKLINEIKIFCQKSIESVSKQVWIVYISVVIEKLSNCPKLQTLILRGNRIYEVSNFECCPQLWNVDLSNNEVRL